LSSLSNLSGHQALANLGHVVISYITTITTSNSVTCLSTPKQTLIPASFRHIPRGSSRRFRTDFTKHVSPSSVVHMPPERGRASQACTACRKQKTRCYEIADAKACLRCERLGQACSLATVGQRRVNTCESTIAWPNNAIAPPGEDKAAR
jgi:hypothetical protein